MAEEDNVGSLFSYKCKRNNNLNGRENNEDATKEWSHEVVCVVARMWL